MEEKIEIQLSKTKIFLLLMGATVFVIIGLLFTFNPEPFTTSRFRNPQIIKMIGIVATAFFGFCMVFMVKKLFDKKIGITIDEYGITDNSNATSIGLIEWNDITEIKTIQIASTKILMLVTDKPDKYIEKAKGISKRAMKRNYKLYGSPLSIISNSLKINYNDLEQLINSEFEKRKNN